MPKSPEKSRLPETHARFPYYEKDSPKERRDAQCDTSSKPTPTGQISLPTNNERKVISDEEGAGAMLKTPIDELKYTIGGENYRINNYITIYNPYVYEVKDFGEEHYFSVLNVFTRKPYDIAVELDDIHIDYQSVTEWDLFYESAPLIPVEQTCILFGKLDFTEFDKCVNPEDGLKFLQNRHSPNIRIDEAIYQKIVAYLRHMHFISEKAEYDVGNSTAKKFLIDRMRRKQKKYLKDLASGKAKPHSQLSDMIKYCVNNSNFKYDYSTIMSLKLNLLYESYFFIIHGNERENVMSGIYHGTIDTTKMKDKSIKIKAGYAI